MRQQTLSSILPMNERSLPAANWRELWVVWRNLSPLPAHAALLQILLESEWGRQYGQEAWSMETNRQSVKTLFTLLKLLDDRDPGLEYFRQLRDVGQLLRTLHQIQQIQRSRQPARQDDFVMHNKSHQDAVAHAT